MPPSRYARFPFPRNHRPSCPSKPWPKANPTRLSPRSHRHSPQCLWVWTSERIRIRRPTFISKIHSDSPSTFSWPRLISLLKRNNHVTCVRLSCHEFNSPAVSSTLLIGGPPFLATLLPLTSMDAFTDCPATTPDYSRADAFPRIAEVRGCEKLQRKI